MDPRSTGRVAVSWVWVFKDDVNIVVFLGVGSGMLRNNLDQYYCKLVLYILKKLNWRCRIKILRRI